jgi:1-aminocyclopropane-1-carboxylate deaminase/D-cysteine desulfhydrase-like pyridoxal-dependent ACC family enzyme
MNDTDDGRMRGENEYLKAAWRLEAQLGALDESMDEVERVGAVTAHSTYMAQAVADRARWHKIVTLTKPILKLADTLADRNATEQLLQLLAPSLVFPAATPFQIDLSGEALHRARQSAELHKENLRKMISAEIKRIDSLGSPE